MWAKELDTNFRYTRDGGLTWNDVTSAPDVWKFEFELDSHTARATVCRLPGENLGQTLLRNSDGGNSGLRSMNSNGAQLKDRSYLLKNGLLAGS